MGLFYTVVLRLKSVLWPFRSNREQERFMSSISCSLASIVCEGGGSFLKFCLVLYLQPIVQRPHFEDAR